MQFKKRYTMLMRCLIKEEEKDILDVVIEKLGGMTKNEIVAFMHKERAYVEMEQKEVISFAYARELRI